MSILNLYQLAFLGTILVTILAAARAKKHFMPNPQTVEVMEVPPQIAPKVSITAPVSMDRVKERIKELDRLFDENLLSVAEYVELRRRALEKPGPTHPLSH